jgi:hypothetical protein
MENKYKAENQYYTPNISEFHIGFEYYWRNKDKFPTDEFQSGIIKDGTQIDDINNGQYEIVVKFLDWEDLRTIGFKDKTKPVNEYVTPHYIYLYDNGRYFVRL